MTSLSPASISAEKQAGEDSDVKVQDGRVVFRHVLLRPFGTVWETRPVSESPCPPLSFSYYNNSKNAHNSNILQVILRDHGFHRAEPPEDDWNIFWCAGQAAVPASRSIQCGK